MSGDRLILEPVRKAGLIGLVEHWQPLDETFPDIADEPAPREDVFG